MTMKQVDVLVFEGCPNVQTTLERAYAAVAATEVQADVRVVHVDSDDDAVRLRFLGSPTVRVDGADIEPAAEARVDFGLQCRVYQVDGRFEGAPPTQWIARALGGARETDTQREPTSNGGCETCR
jgi:hypothetical protein